MHALFYEREEVIRSKKSFSSGLIKEHPYVFISAVRVELAISHALRRLFDS